MMLDLKQDLLALGHLDLMQCNSKKLGQFKKFKCKMYSLFLVEVLLMLQYGYAAHLKAEVQSFQYAVI